jgi:hypothetical protein
MVLGLHRSVCAALPIIIKRYSAKWKQNRPDPGKNFCKGPTRRRKFQLLPKKYQILIAKCLSMLYNRKSSIEATAKSKSFEYILGKENRHEQV